MLRRFFPKKQQNKTKSSHPKDTILCIFRGTVQGSRDGKSYNLSCISGINNTIIPEPCGRVIWISFSPVCLYYLCLECVFFFLAPLQCHKQNKKGRPSISISNDSIIFPTKTTNCTLIPCFFLLPLSI